MRIISSINGALVQATTEQMRTVAADPHDFDQRPSEQSLFTFAKCFYLGGGWWRISGYSWDRADVKRVLDRLSHNAAVAP